MHSRPHALLITIISAPIETQGTNFMLANASDDRDIDVLREQIKQFAETRALFSKGFELITLDEVDVETIDFKPQARVYLLDFIATIE